METIKLTCGSNLVYKNRLHGIIKNPAIIEVHVKSKKEVKGKIEAEIEVEKYELEGCKYSREDMNSYYNRKRAIKKARNRNTEWHENRSKFKVTTIRKETRHNNREKEIGCHKGRIASTEKYLNKIGVFVSRTYIYRKGVIKYFPIENKHIKDLIINQEKHKVKNPLNYHEYYYSVKVECLN